MIHDRVRVYDADIVTRLAGLGSQNIRTPVRSPKAHTIGGGGGPYAASASTTSSRSPAPPVGAGRVRRLPRPRSTYRSLGLETPVPSRLSAQRGGGLPTCPRWSALRPRASRPTPTRPFCRFTRTSRILTDHGSSTEAQASLWASRTLASTCSRRSVLVSGTSTISSSTPAAA